MKKIMLLTIVGLCAGCASLSDLQSSLSGKKIQPDMCQHVKFDLKDPVLEEGVNYSKRNTNAWHKYQKDKDYDKYLAEMRRGALSDNNRDLVQAYSSVCADTQNTKRYDLCSLGDWEYTSGGGIDELKDYNKIQLLKLSCLCKWHLAVGQNCSDALTE